MDWRPVATVFYFARFSMLMRTGHDLSMRFDIELFHAISLRANKEHRDIAANFKLKICGAWVTAALIRPVGLESYNRCFRRVTNGSI